MWRGGLKRKTVRHRYRTDTSVDLVSGAVVVKDVRWRPPLLLSLLFGHPYPPARKHYFLRWHRVVGGVGMHLRPFSGTALLPILAVSSALFAAVGLAVLLTDQVFAQNSAPDFGATTATRSVDENTASYTNIGTPITATDGNSDDLVYSIQDGSKTHFGIDESTGQLWVGNQRSYEYQKSYTVVVKATDPSEDSDTITVTISINDLEEEGEVSFDWRRAQVNNEITASLADADGSVSGVTWQWSSSSTKEGEYVDIDSATSASYTPVSADLDNYLKATASYTDRRGSGKTASSIVPLPVRAVPETNNPPDLAPPSDTTYTCESPRTTDFCRFVKRYHPIGSVLYNPMGIRQGDLGDEYKYSLEGQDAASFDILEDGDLKTKISFTHANRDYLLTVRVTDLSGASSTQTITVYPVANENPPVTTAKGFDTYSTTSGLEVEYTENGTWLVADLDSARRDGPAFTSWIIKGDDSNYFSIDSDGILTFRCPPDFDAPSDSDGNNEYSIYVYPNTGASFPQARIFVIVKIADLADGISVTGPDLVTIRENSAQAIGTYAVAGSHSLVLLGTDIDDFQLDNNGELTFTNPPDFETPTDANGDNLYELEVGVTDDANVKARKVNVTVLDMAEDLDITGPASPIDHNENDSSAVGQFTGYDPQGGTFTWTLSGIDRGDFRLEESGDTNEYADLYFDPTPNYEDAQDDDTDNHYEISLVATASGSDKTLDLEVNVSPVNEAPVFTRGESTRDYVEGDTTIVDDYDAIDPEGENVTFLITGADTDDLEIDGETGELSFKSPPDFDQPSNSSNVYQVNVVATDESGESSSKAVTVNVTPVNEPPVITYNGNSGDQTIEYDENGTGDVATFVATDEDSSTITWTKSGDDATLFSLSNAGVLTFNASPDFEDPKDQGTNNAYQVTIEASDGTNDAVMNVTVEVQDVDEDPVVTGDTGPSVVEGGTGTIASYTADDPEGETPTWEDPTGDDGSLFEISSAGKLSFKAAPDFETPGSAAGTNVYQVKINASDGTNTGSLDVTVTVVDSNESIIREGTWTTSLDYPENSNATVATYAARDPEGEDIDWDLDGGDDDKLDISDAGVVTFNTIPDFESPADHDTDGEYEITVIASDGTNKETQDVLITITNVNEAPVLTVVEEVTFAEGGTGTVVTFEVTDPDANTTITWSLSGDDAGDFNTISKPTNEPFKGQLTFKNTPDRENATDADTNNEYEITVKATDEGSLYDEMNVTVVVSDEDETPTLSGPTAFEWLENAHTTLATYNAADPEDDPITWDLLGDDKDLFNLTPQSQGASTAHLAFRSAPDFEESDPAKQDHNNDDVYEITIQASDGNANHVQTMDVEITVIDVNETPVIDAISIDDYVENGTGDVADFSATDPENDTLEWTLSGDDDAYFDIDDSTGVLTFKSPPDYELEVDGSRKYTYSLTVQASDDEFTAILSITVTVTDVDEDPVISGETDGDTDDPNFDHEENDASPVHRFSANDPEGTAITWDLEGVDEALFRINGGTLEFLSEPNYEDPRDSGGNNVYNITIKVTDNTSKSATLPVTVTVTNINEDPAFDAETATVDVAEGTAANRNIGSPFKATDEDRLDRLAYTLAGTDAASFNMVDSHSSGAQLRTKAVLDYETKDEYSVTILVRDGVDDTGDPNVTADDTIDITIDVTNIDENGTVSLSNEQPEEEQSITATLEDDDGGITNLTWQWATASAKTSSSWTNATGTTTLSGLTSTYTAVNADVNKYLRATASYTDAQGGSKTAHGVSANRVDPRPPDPQPPEFSQTSVTRQVAENATVGTNVGQPVTARDPERKALTYSLEGTDAADFDIVQSSGQIKTKAGVTLDYETDQSHSVIVKATDPSNLTDTIAVTINIVDVDEPPGKVVINTVMQSPGNEKSGLMVKWSPPENSGPDITGYNLKYAPQGTSSWEEEETSNTQKELGDLWPDTEYQVMVNAENTEGEGTWSEIGEGRTDAKPVSEWFTLTANFASSSYSVREGSRVRITVNLVPASDRRQSITFDAASNTGSSSIFSIPASVDFAPGDESISFYFSANQDSDKNNETVTVSFGASMPNKVTAGTINSTTVTIHDDDRTPPPAPQPVPVPTPEPTPDPTPEPTPTPTTPSVPSTPAPPGGGGGGGGGFFSGGSGSGGSGSGGSSGGSASSDANRPPYFNEGVATERTIVEHTRRAAFLGDPVTATDPDGDVLTYALGGIDADSFALDTQTGQLITRAVLDFELKPSYDVVMTVVDGRGAADAIEITIKIIDLTEVPIYSPETQAAALLKPGEATTIETPDGAASVSFPAQSRDGYYWARLDSASTRCGFDPGDEESQASLIVEFFDQWGTREHQVVLINPATVELRLDASSFGGTEAVLAAHARGAFSVYARNYTTLQWSQVAFTLAVDDEGRVIITLAELTSLDCFAVTTLAALFTPEQPVATPTPTPTPVPAPRAQVQPTPTPAPKAEPQPTPTVESEGIKIPLLIPQAVAEAGEVANPTPETPDSAEQTELTPAPVAMEAQLGPELEDGGLSVWPILLMALGAALLASSLWLFLSAKRRRRF